MDFNKIKKNVVAPNHYCGKSGMQVIDYVDSLDVKILFKNNEKGILLTKDSDDTYCFNGRLITIYSYLFNMIKYLFRAGKKDNTVQEYAKIVEYCRNLMLELDKIDYVSVDIVSNKYSLDFISKDYDFDELKMDILVNILDGKFSYVLETINKKVLNI